MASNLRYDYVGGPWVAEGADWDGAYDGLRTHFHDEIQVSILSKGRRRYLLGRRAVTLSPGQILIIPAGIVHRALPTFVCHTQSTDFFLRPAQLPIAIAEWISHSNHVLLTAPWLPGLARVDIPETIVAIITRLNPQTGPILHRDLKRSDLEQVQLSISSQSACERQHVASRAKQLGLSAEGYIRIFARQFGMTPYAHQLNTRLNLGRQLLRQGVPPVEAAQATGFCDQSHFGRHFLGTFGATPAHFRAAHLQQGAVRSISY